MFEENQHLLYLPFRQLSHRYTHHHHPKKRSSLDYGSDEDPAFINIIVSDYTSSPVSPISRILLGPEDTTMLEQQQQPKQGDFFGASAAFVRPHLEDLEELLAELEEEVRKRDLLLGEERADSLGEGASQLARAMAAKLEWCREGLGELHRRLAEKAAEARELEAVAAGKEEQIRRLEAERGELLQKVRGLQQQAALLARLAGGEPPSHSPEGEGDGGARRRRVSKEEELARCLREKCETVDALKEEVRRNRRTSIIDDRDELIEKVHYINFS